LPIGLFVGGLALGGLLAGRLLAGRLLAGGLVFGLKLDTFMVDHPYSFEDGFRFS
jgi:hypothetical protein